MKEIIDPFNESLPFLKLTLFHKFPNHVRICKPTDVSQCSVLLFYCNACHLQPQPRDPDVLGEPVRAPQPTLPDGTPQPRSRGSLPLLRHGLALQVLHRRLGNDAAPSRFSFTKLSRFFR